MTIYLDDVEYHPHLAPTESVEALITEIVQGLADGGRIVVGVRCDGIDVTGDGFTDRVRQPLTQYRRIDVSTGTRGELVRDAVQQAIVLCEATDAERLNVAEQLVAGHHQDALDNLGPLLGAWHKINETIIGSLSMLERDLDALQWGTRSAAETLEEIKDQLAQIREALDAKDFVMLADILEHEFGAVNDLWKQMLGTLRDLAAPAAAETPSADAT